MVDGAVGTGPIPATCSSAWICAQPVNRDQLLKTKKTSRATEARRKSLVARPGNQCVLRLFVAGATARSREAVLLVRQLCEVELRGGCTLEVIDIYQQPKLARVHQIVATPTLIKELPRPVRRFIGSLANITGRFGDLDLGPRDKIAV